jgi:rare lipoprotein A
MQRSSLRRINYTAVILPALLINVFTSIDSHAANSTSGKATVYSDHFKGKKTATGETYKPNELTTASNKLPIGSKVLLTSSSP